VPGEIPGHRQAHAELAEIQRRTGRTQAMRVEQVGQVRRGWLPIEISLDCATVARGPDGVRLAPREHATVQVPATFPFSLPGVRVAHQRFAGLPYVLHGHYICLYHSDSDWDPARGMFGVIGRLITWYRRAAAGRLVEQGQPLHPPLAYPSRFGQADCVVIGVDLPADFAPVAAIMVRKYPARADVVRWLGPAALELSRPPVLDRLKKDLADVARAHEKPAFLAAVKILRQPLSFEFPETFPALLDALAAEHVHSAELLRDLAKVWGANKLAAIRRPGPAPLHVILGAPMRGIAGADRLDMHLAVWQLNATEAAVPDMLTGAGDPRDQPPAWLQAAQDKALARLYYAPLSWAFVQENRRQLVTRRDTGKPAQWLLGKSVLVLGCGALGARIAEHCARAGVRKLLLVDNHAVGTGLLVRQPYQDADIGLPKAWQLAGRLAQIRPSPGLEVEAEIGDIRDTVLGGDTVLPKVDLIVDATANRGVSARIEWLRRGQPGRWPPVLTVGVGHACERAVGALALPQASGAGTDILYALADRAFQDSGLRDVAEDFFTEPDPGQLFQPEIGCSEPTFSGSDPEVAAAAGLLFTWALRVLNDQATRRPVPAKSLFLARLPGDPVLARLPGERGCAAQVYLDWPNDLLAEDGESGYQLRVRAPALEQMRREARSTARRFPPSWETGGVLFGYIDDACRVAWVTDVAGPTADSERGHHTFQLDPAGVADLIDRYYRGSGGRVRFLGMWHTHPGLVAEPSRLDLQAMARVLGETPPARFPRRVAHVIAGGDPDRWDYWLLGIGQPDIGFRLFSWNQFHPDGGTARGAEQEQ
jgi:integrative and conjugative element protein (TIGR02256 family)